MAVKTSNQQPHRPVLSADRTGHHSASMLVLVRPAQSSQHIVETGPQKARTRVVRGHRGVRNLVSQPRVLKQKKTPRTQTKYPHKGADQHAIAPKYTAHRDARQEGSATRKEEGTPLQHPNGLTTPAPTGQASNAGTSGLQAENWPGKRQTSTISASFKRGQEKAAPSAYVSPCTSSSKWPK